MGQDRAHYLPVPHCFNLNMACHAVAAAFDWSVYLVGSCLERRDYRDVDVRVILDDAHFDRLFPGVGGHAGMYDGLWSLMCASTALYLAQHSGGLPIDFQIQRRTEANAQFGKQRRFALGILHHPRAPGAELFDRQHAPEPPNKTCPICWLPLDGSAESLCHEFTVHRACDTRPRCEKCDEAIGAPYSHEVCASDVQPPRKFS